MNSLSFEEILDRALQEDISAGDLTTESTVSKSLNAVAVATAKSELVVCGGELFCATFRKLDPGCTADVLRGDGERAGPGEALWRIDGKARALLLAERTALNFVQRMSGIATLTQEYVRALPQGSRTRITDTRKTTPGLRALERYAVRTGGAHNHRDSLSSAVMIKDNHIIAAGGIRAALEMARAYAPHTSKLEIEVESLEMLDEALAANADIIMLDNFAEGDIATAVARCKGRALVEVSGGITLQRIHSLASAGVDVISVGALTHSAKAADISFGISIPHV